MTKPTTVRLLIILLAVVFVFLCVYIIYQATSSSPCTSSPFSPLPSPSSKEEEIFFTFDLNRDNVLSLGEVSQVLHYLGVPSSLQGNTYKTSSSSSSFFLFLFLVFLFLFLVSSLLPLLPFFSCC
jgi:predicted PurR-regulated permease PerM